MVNVSRRCLAPDYDGNADRNDYTDGKNIQTLIKQWHWNCCLVAVVGVLLSFKRIRRTQSSCVTIEYEIQKPTVEEEFINSYIPLGIV